MHLSKYQICLDRMKSEPEQVRILFVLINNHMIVLTKYLRNFARPVFGALLGTIFISGVAVSALYIPPSHATPSKSPVKKTRSLAEFGGLSPSADARRLADWVAHTHDNGGADFMIVDKRNARVYVFDAAAKLRASSPVLLGAAKGDDSVPGIGTRPIAEVRPEERTTPAGRFVAERGHNLKGEDIVWVDYDAAVSMHRVRATNPTERRLQRLATPTVSDNRISYGCINVPVSFYETHVKPTVANQRVIVYVLPEVKSIKQVFGSLDVPGHRTR